MDTLIERSQFRIMIDHRCENDSFSVCTMICSFIVELMIKQVAYTIGVGQDTTGLKLAFLGISD